MSAKFMSIAAALVLASAGAAAAQDAMSTNTMGSSAMAPMMSDDDLAKCLEQARAITFPEVAMAAEQACHSLQNGEEVMGGDAMGGGAMSSSNPM